MSTASKPVYEWKDLPSKQIEHQVFKLQKRIYQASGRGDLKTVHKLQRLLIASWTARCLAVRKVTQDNRGKKTAGGDRGQVAYTTTTTPTGANATSQPAGQTEAAGLD